MNYESIPPLKYTAGLKYQVEEEISCMSGILGYSYTNRYYSIEPNGKMTAFVGCAYDGASGAFDTPAFMTSALFHDIGCWLIAKGILPQSCQPQIDAMLRDIAIAKGMWKWKAKLAYKFVRFHFRNGTKPEEREILTAP